MTACRSCHASVLWAVTEAGKRIPLDPTPITGGNVILTGEQDPETGSPIVRVVGSTMELGEDPARARYVSHFVTCPNADAHRRSR